MVEFLSGFSCGVLLAIEILTLLLAIDMRHRGYLMRATVNYLSYFLAITVVCFTMASVWNPLGDMRFHFATLLQSTMTTSAAYYFHRVIYVRRMPPSMLAVHAIPYIVLGTYMFATKSKEMDLVILAVTDVHAIWLVIRGYRKLHHYHVTLANYASTTPGTELRWIKLIMPVLLCMLAAWNVPVILPKSVWPMVFNYSCAFGLAVLTYFVLRHTLSATDILHNWDLVHEQEFRASKPVADLIALRKRQAETKTRLEAQRQRSANSNQHPLPGDDLPAIEGHDCAHCSISDSCELRRQYAAGKVVKQCCNATAETPSEQTLQATTQHTVQLATTIVQQPLSESSTELPTTTTEPFDFSMPETADRFEGQLESIMEEEQLYLNSELTLGDLADRLGSNITYVSQHINQHLNMSFYDFVNAYRMRRAEELLRTTDDTLDQVAINSGFNSQSSFYRYFKKVHRMTPTAYRKNASK